MLIERKVRENTVGRKEGKRNEVTERNEMRRRKENVINFNISDFLVILLEFSLSLSCSQRERFLKRVESSFSLSLSLFQFVSSFSLIFSSLRRKVIYIINQLEGLINHIMMARKMLGMQLSDKPLSFPLRFTFTSQDISVIPLFYSSMFHLSFSLISFLLFSNHFSFHSFSHSLSFLLSSSFPDTSVVSLSSDDHFNNNVNLLSLSAS